MRVESRKMLTRSLHPLAGRAAFTLMEVLVVVAILVVLAGVGGVIYLRVQEDSYRDLARLRAKDIETAVRAYMRSHQDTPPGSLQELAAPSDGGRPYIQMDQLVDPWGMPYNYRPQPQAPQNSVRGVPDIYSSGPNRVDDGGSGDDIGNW